MHNKIMPGCLACNSKMLFASLMGNIGQDANMDVACSRSLVSNSIDNLFHCHGF